MRIQSFPSILGLLLVAVFSRHVGAADSLTGAGSSAAAPVYRIWAEEYLKKGGEPIGYDPVGSGSGMKKIKRREVDFGASDVIAPTNELAKDDMVMFPTVISGVVPVVNIPRLSTPLKLSGEVLAGIFLGEITHWNAPELARLNPGENLPNLLIQVVCRSDGSGTTYHFSDYLAKVSAAWKTRYGVANVHPWPASFVAVRGSKEVSRTVRNTPGAIGYIDYNYVVEDGLTGTEVRNAAGRFITASTESFMSAVGRSPWFSEGDFSRTLTNLDGDGTWPITMGTYVAVPRIASDSKRSARVLHFFTWAFANGNALAKQAKFVPLPERVQAKAFREISAIKGSKGEPIGLESLSALIYGAR
jgi:phosphate transport system substrate-binding protein